MPTCSGILCAFSLLSQQAPASRVAAKRAWSVSASRQSRWKGREAWSSRGLAKRALPLGRPFF